LKTDKKFSTFLNCRSYRNFSQSDKFTTSMEMFDSTKDLCTKKCLS